MKQIIISTILFITILFMYSCQSEDSFDSNQEETTDVYPQKGTMKFTYKGVDYSSDYIKHDDSSTFFTDEETDKIFKELSSLPELMTFIHEDKSIEFFDNVQDMEKNLVLKESQLRASYDICISSVYLATYEHSKLKGKKVEFSKGVDTSEPQFNPSTLFNVSDLGIYDMDNKISSIKWSCEVVDYNHWPILAPRYTKTVAVFFDGKNFQGPSIAFAEVTINYRKSECHYFGSEPHPNGDWNDKPSSMKLYLF